MNEQEFRELAAGYALHALSADERARFEQALDEHPEWSTIVEVDVATAAALAEAAPEVAPPPAMRDLLLATIAVTPQHAGTAPEDASELLPTAGDESDPEGNEQSAEPPTNTTTMQSIERRTWTRSLLALAACLVLLVGVGFGAGTLNEMLNRPAAVVALNEIEDAPDAESASVQLDDGLTATAHWSESVGKVVLVSDGLPAVATDREFELWYVRGSTPIPAGVFTAGADGQATALLDGTFHSGDTIAVTVEAVGGSPSGLPTTDPILAIPTA